MTRWIRMLLLALALGSFTVHATGCYGSYGLTMKLYKWNGTIGNKVARGLVHFALWVVPAYPLFGLVDWLVLNNIEFLTGSPVLASAPGTRTVVKANEREVHITTGEKTVVLKSEQEGQFSLWVANKQVGHGNITPEGGLIFSDDVGKQTRYLSPSFVEKMRAAASQRMEKLAASGAIQDL
ncbi:MAG: DUF3332 family protein [Deltaproteobacteria bacterium]|nr:DUF3332 family protein [Deltaproteobacteria bacterium]